MCMQFSRQNDNKVKNPGWYQKTCRRINQRNFEWLKIKQPPLLYSEMQFKNKNGSFGQQTKNLSAKCQYWIIPVFGNTADTALRI